jgi:hypothetical protein
MKITTIVLMFLFVTRIAISLEIGDSIVEFLKEHPAEFSNEKFFLSLENWPDSATLVIFSTHNIEDANLLLYLNFSFVPFAAEIVQTDGRFFLVDIDGDTILDYRSDRYLYPYWCIPQLFGSDKDSRLNEILNLFFNTFQSNTGPVLENPLMREALALFNEICKDIRLPDRDIVHALMYYISHATSNPRIAIANINWMNERYIERYNSTHPLFLLFYVEMFIRLDQLDRARSINDDLMNIAPEFIPAKVLDFRLETDPRKKKKKIKNLYKEYPEHWLVKAYYR